MVEGPDGSGKTTLVRRLSEALSWPIAPRVVDKRTNPLISSLKGWVEENLEKGSHCTIYDRHRLLSEPIYGPIFRKALTDGFDDIHWFRDRWTRFQHTECIVVFCLPPFMEVHKNVRQGTSNLTVIDSTPEIYWQYWALCARMLTRSDTPKHPVVMQFDYTRQEHEEDVEWLVGYTKSFSRKWSLELE